MIAQNLLKSGRAMWVAPTRWLKQVEVEAARAGMRGTNSRRSETRS